MRHLCSGAFVQPAPQLQDEGLQRGSAQMWIGIRIPSCADRSRGKPQQQKRLDSRGLRVLWHATPHIGPDFRDPDSPARHRRTFPNPKAPTPVSAKRPTLAVQGTCAGVWQGSGGAPSQSRSTLRSGRSGNGAWPKGNPRGGRSARPSPERKKPEKISTNNRHSHTLRRVLLGLFHQRPLIRTQPAC